MIVEKREESFKGSESEVNTFSFDGYSVIDFSLHNIYIINTFTGFP